MNGHHGSNSRGQTELPALGIAFILLTAAIVLGVSVANTAFTSAERSALERQTAVSISEYLVSETSPHTDRQNVILEDRLDSVDATTIAEEFDLESGTAFEVRLGNRTIAKRGQVGPGEGSRIERIVLVENRTRTELQPRFSESLSTTLPRRSYDTKLTIDPPDGSVVHTVRAGDRTILHDETGLEGTFDLTLSPLETTRLWFDSAGPLPGGSVEIAYDQPETRKAMLTVMVDA